jgi:hypothetical protein
MDSAMSSPPVFEAFGNYCLSAFASLQTRAHHHAMKGRKKKMRLAYTLLSQRRSKKDSGEVHFGRQERADD